MDTPSTSRLRVWDWPTRLFHWLLAACTLGLIVTAKLGGNAMEWHLRLGHVMVALLLFRVLWGLKGGHWSRFATWCSSLARLPSYLRGKAQPIDRVGHSPLGSLAAIVLLLALALQVGTGLVSDDEIAFAGSLTRWVDSATVAWATSWHHGWGEVVLWTVLGLHIAAIAYYCVVRRQGLVGAMLHGDQASEAADLPASADGPGQWLVALIFAFASAIMAYWVWTRGSF
ncbi:MAG: cytochrome b/b6 domain-containing protein [Comamonas sp.]